MAAYATEVEDVGFSSSLTPNQVAALEAACHARGAVLDLVQGLVTLRGTFLNGRCTDLQLPPGLHLTRAGVQSAPGETCFRISRV
ncbi:MAG: hypothetical protein AAFU77_03740 [Myxococcota bacterium]